MLFIYHKHNTMINIQKGITDKLYNRQAKSFFVDIIGFDNFNL